MVRFKPNRKRKTSRLQGNPTTPVFINDVAAKPQSAQELSLNEGEKEMRGIRRLSAWLAPVVLFGAAVMLSLPAGAQDQPKVGTVKSINGNTLVLKSDSGPDVTVTVQDTTRIARLAQGQPATPMKLEEVQVGDRMLIRGTPGATADSVTATSIRVMKGSDVAQRQQQDLQDWQKRGVGGIVTGIDAAAGSVTISVTPTISFVVKTSPTTGYLRYSPNSVKFADAVKGSFDQIKTGDQLRARGDRSADGKEVAAEQVISGTFRNIAGTITAIDTANGAITVKDILAKKSVVVKLTSDSQMRKLPPQMAGRIALVLKGSGGAGGSPTNTSASPGGGPGAGGPGGGPGGPGGPGGGRPGGGGMDFQQMLSRLPAAAIADLQKDDAVMIVSTAGSGSEVTAITLLSGVEPIFTASPDASSAAALLSGWNLGTPGGGGGDQ